MCPINSQFQEVRYIYIYIFVFSSGQKGVVSGADAAAGGGQAVRLRRSGERRQCGADTQRAQLQTGGRFREPRAGSWRVGGHRER